MTHTSPAASRPRVYPSIRFTLSLLLAGLIGCENVDQNVQNSKTPKKDTDSEVNGTAGPYGTDPGSTDNPYGTDSNNPCAGPNPPADLCQMVPSGPACGDGALNQASEYCDDGNTLPGDGCTGICRVEPYWECPTPGQPCQLQIVCGNGRLEAGEVCDDGDTIDDNGCNATCDVQSANFICPNPGQPCERVVFCGDGRINGDETCEDDDPREALENGDGCDVNCHKEPSWVCLVPGTACTPGPRCGDSLLSVGNNEVCDDGNTLDGDGCSADCTVIESGWVCPSPGNPCQNTTVCGNGVVTGEETCDDANDDPNDGCDACVLQPGYVCPYPGAKCLAKCGDGMIIMREVCDDGNTEDGDGCSSICEWEKGFVCNGPPGNYTCKPTVCGDGIPEGTEACDDGNHDMGDGCTPTCSMEPSCEGGACTSTCGDGLVLESVGEECDDGNRSNEDGCSSDCKVEPSYECHQPPLGESMVVPIVYRDFKGYPAGGHEDFERGVSGSVEALPGLVETTLDADGKPVYAGADYNGHITSQQSFSEWFRDAPSNTTVVSTLSLFDNGEGGYVNRFGENGEQFAYYTDAVWCGQGGGTGCDQCTEDEYDVCQDPCDYWGNGNTSACGLRATYMDGNPVFFPVDDLPGANPVMAAKIPPPYADSWPWESAADGEDGPQHNYSFTSEVRYWFQYDADTSYTLTFLGDDDVWVFINNRLALDLGGIHTPVEGSVTLRTQADGAEFGLADGQVYEIVVFQAERQTNASSYKLTLSGFNAAASDCGPICGDGVMAPGEQCDDGDNPGGYGKCNPDCTKGPYCGDGEVYDGTDENGNPLEQCDDGLNVSAYGTASTGCSPGCVLPPYCGDGITQMEFGETCDDGINSGEFGGCSPDCQAGPWCGDGIVEQGIEACDDGLNDGTYNTCAPGCVLGPRCGDGELQADWGEECDDGNLTPGDDCSPNCRLEGVCGDALKGPDEECDDGINDGGYGECAPGCRQGPHCGDGVVEDSIRQDTGLPYEQCDDGINDGGYGECSPGCVLGPHCGDGRLQPEYEECDDGNQDDRSDDCTNACKEIRVIPV